MEAVSEQKNLKMHKKLLLDVIKKQAGSLEKAILEGVMNSIEAGAVSVLCNFSVDENNNKASLSIYDDGIGISTEKELIEHFETFGTPHDESENVIWKQFRMGRGQMFAFGKNTWRTSTFKMEVDIDNWGLIYHLTKNLPHVDGCTIDIELYKNPIGSYTYPTIDSLIESIRKQIEFVKTPVLFNDKQLNTAPEVLDGWTHEDENAYYLFNAGDGVKVYNLGAFVKKIEAYVAGTSGIIVSKKRLDVNFARNDVQCDCPIFGHIDEVIKKNRIKNANSKKKYKSLSTNERVALLRDFRDARQPYEDLVSKRIFKSTQGKWLSLKMIFQSKLPWTFAENGSMEADRAIELGRAVCLSESILDYLNYRDTRADFFEWFLRAQLRIDLNKSDYEQNVKSWNRDNIKKKITEKTKNYIPYDQNDFDGTESRNCLLDSFSSEYNIVPKKKLNIVEKRILKVLQNYGCWDSRTLHIGTSDTAIAWTNGADIIVLERSWLKKLKFSWQEDTVMLFTTLCHELAHDEETDGTHQHGPDFYENYYRITTKRHSNPLANIWKFKRDMNSAVMDRKRQAVIDKQKQAEEKIKEKLGIKSS